MSFGVLDEMEKSSLCYREINLEDILMHGKISLILNLDSKIWNPFVRFFLVLLVNAQKDRFALVLPLGIRELSTDYISHLVTP